MMEQYAWLTEDKIGYRGHVYARKGEKVKVLKVRADGLVHVQTTDNRQEGFYIKKDRLSNTPVSKKTNI